MGTFKGTKGEWVAWEHTPNTFAIKPNGSRTELARVYAGGDVEVDEMKANAKLITAAPALLLALEMAVMVMPNGQIRNDCKAILKQITD